MSEGERQVYGLVKIPVAPANMIFTKQLGEAEMGMLNGDPVIIQTMKHIPTTVALRHCPTVPLSESNYSFGLEHFVNKQDDNEEKEEEVETEEDKDMMESIIQHQAEVFKKLNLTESFKNQDGSPPAEAQDMMAFSRNPVVEVNNKHITVRTLSFGSTRVFSFQPVTTVVVGMKKKEVDVFFEERKRSRSDNTFNKYYVEYHEKFLGGAPAPEVSKESSLQTSNVGTTVPGVKRKFGLVKDSGVKVPKMDHQVADVGKATKRKGGLLKDKVPKVDHQVADVGKATKRKGDLLKDKVPKIDHQVAHVGKDTKRKGDLHKDKVPKMDHQVAHVGKDTKRKGDLHKDKVPKMDHQVADVGKATKRKGDLHKEKVPKMDHQVADVGKATKRKGDLHKDKVPKMDHQVADVGKDTKRKGDLHKDKVPKMDHQVADVGKDTKRKGDLHKDKVPKMDHQVADVGKDTKRKGDLHKDKVPKMDHQVADFLKATSSPKTNLVFKIPKISRQTVKSSPENSPVSLHTEVAEKDEVRTTSSSQKPATSSPPHVEVQDEVEMPERNSPPEKPPVFRRMMMEEEDDDDVLDILADGGVDDLLEGLDDFVVKNPTRIRTFNSSSSSNGGGLRRF